jgi:hypothetical protein
MPIIEQEARVAGTREDGSTVLLPEVEVKIENVATGQEYNSDVEAAEDVANPETATSQNDIKRSVTMRVLKGVGAEGGAG